MDGDEQEHTKAAEGAAPDSEAAGRALFTAARGGHADMVSALLAQGTHPDPVWCEDSGLTPLHAAAMGGHHEVVAALLGAGAKHDRPIGSSSSSSDGSGAQGGGGAQRTALDLLPAEHRVQRSEAYRLLKERAVAAAAASARQEL